MKQVTKILCALTVLLALSAATYGQVGASATSSSTATIVGPIAITRTAVLSFGNIAVDANPGTVALDPATSARSVTGGCTLPAAIGTVTPATFNVTGVSGYTYGITIPNPVADVITLSDGAGHTMTVDTWTSTPSGSGTLTGGSQVLTVGATLHVGGGQTAGTYNSTADFTVWVNYN